jgi:cytochrome c oxidase assembly protein subunit 15
MSGMKAGLYYPTWPDMHGEFFPQELINSELWTYEHIVNYERGPVPGVVQFGHRIFADLITIATGLLFSKALKGGIPSGIKKHTLVLLLIGILQGVLGILTVTNSVGKIPLVLGVLHQIGAIVLLTFIIVLHRRISS